MGSPKFRLQYHIMNTGQSPPVAPKVINGRTSAVRKSRPRRHSNQPFIARTRKSAGKITQASKRIDSEMEMSTPATANRQRVPFVSRRQENTSSAENSMKNR